MHLLSQHPTSISPSVKIRHLLLQRIAQSLLLQNLMSGIWNWKRDKTPILIRRAIAGGGRVVVPLVG
jgi:hypothetical protein